MDFLLRTWVISRSSSSESVESETNWPKSPHSPTSGQKNINPVWHSIRPTFAKKQKPWRIISGTPNSAIPSSSNKRKSHGGTLLPTGQLCSGAWLEPMLSRGIPMNGLPKSTITCWTQALGTSQYLGLSTMKVTWCKDTTKLWGSIISDDFLISTRSVWRIIIWNPFNCITLTRQLDVGHPWNLRAWQNRDLALVN